MFSFENEQVFIQKTNHLVDGSVCYQLSSKTKQVYAIVASRLSNGSYIYDKLLTNHELEFFYLNEDKEITQHQSVFLTINNNKTQLDSFEGEYPDSFFIFQKKTFLPFTISSHYIRKRERDAFLCH